MEKRLTFEGNFCDIAMCRENPCPYNGSCSQKETWERLKQYEDTGFSPDEMNELIREIEVRALLWFEKKYGMGAGRMMELAQADKAGRLAVLPCKIGDDIWWIDDEEPYVKCEKGDVQGFAIKKDGVQLIDRCGSIDIIGTRYCYLTKEDAEKALEEGTYNG